MSTEQPEESVIYSGHPSWRSMFDFHLGGIGLAVLAGAIGKFAAGWGVAVAVFLAILLISLLVGFVRRAAVRYTITDRRLYIRHGLFSRSEQHATLDRVQNVEANQSLFERLLGIGTVDFDTAATDGSVFAFAGVAAPSALSLPSIARSTRGLTVASTTPEAIVAAHALTRRYGEGEAAVNALAGVSVDFPPARFAAIMGASGSGKSTLMHLLAGLDRPSSGSVVLDGANLGELDDTALTLWRREHVGFVFQTFNLLSILDARENILLPLAIAGNIVIAVLVFVRVLNAVCVHVYVQVGVVRFVIALVAHTVLSLLPGGSPARPVTGRPVRSRQARDVGFAFAGHMPSDPRKSAICSQYEQIFSFLSRRGLGAERGAAQATRATLRGRETFTLARARQSP